MNYIEVIKKPENTPVKITKILDPLIEEVINGSFTFSFIALIDPDSVHLKHGAEILVDGERFTIASKSKTRGEYPKLILECDHISYVLSGDSYMLQEEEYETTPRAIVESLLIGSQFTLKEMQFNQVVYFRPGEQSVRGRLIELANFLGGEIIWSNYDISFVGARGTADGADFETGVNVKSITENIKTANGRLEQSLEIELIDLSHLLGNEERPGYSAAKSVNMGDSIGIKDVDLDIDTRSRVVSRRYNPFKKFIPQISVGRVIPDILEYFRDEEEKEEKDQLNTGAGLSFRGSGGLSVDTKESAADKIGGLSLKGSGRFSVTWQPEEEEEPGTSEYKDWLTSLSIGGENVLAASGLDKTSQAQAGEIKSPPIIEVSKQWGDFLLKIPKDKVKDYYINIYAKNLINGRMIKVYNKDNFVGNELKGAGWGPFEIDRETGRYVIEFRSNNGYDLAGIVKAFAFNATLTLPEDLDEWPDSGGGGKDGYFVEFGRVKLSDEMYFEFKNTEGYEGYAYITHAIVSGQVAPSDLAISFNEVYSGNKIIGVEAYSNHTATDPEFFAFVTMQAICGGEILDTPPV